MALPTLLMIFLIGTLSAQEIQLVSDQPIEFDEAKKQMIATGEATLTYGDLVLRANRIVYNEESGRAEAEGNIRISQKGYRLLAERLRIDLASREVEAEKVRFGSPPIYAEAEFGAGDQNRIELKNAHVFYREPDRYTPKLTVENFMVEDGAIIMGKGVRFEALGWPIWYLPEIRIPTDVDPIRVSTNLGTRGNLGGFFQSQILFPISNTFFAGGNFDYYSERGLLLGPALALDKETETSATSSHISTGFFRDGGDRGVDIFAKPVPRNRHFITGDIRHVWAGQNQVHGVINSGSDPEIARDLHYDRFFHNQQPDNFLEFIHQKPNWTFSALARVDANDFYHPLDLPVTLMAGPSQRAFLFEEKLPQVSFDLHPTHLAGGIYQELGVKAAQSAHTFHVGDLSRKEPFTSLDGFYRLSKNVASNGSMGLQLFAGLRWVNWKDAPTLTGRTEEGSFAIPYPQFAHMPTSGALVEELDIETRSYSQVMGDIGFNWEARYSRKWQLQNRVWNIDGLKHVVKPYLQMRHNPTRNPAGPAIPEGMVYARDTNLPNWDLATRRDMVFAQEQTLARIGLKNQALTRRKDYGSRELANWDVAADYFFAGPFQDDISFLYSEFSFAPARWLEIGTYSRFSSDNLELRELNSQVRIQDSDLWHLQYGNALAKLNRGFGYLGRPERGRNQGLYPFLEVDQHSLEVGYKISEKFRLLAWVRYDFVLNDFSEQHYSLFQRFGRAVEVEYRLSLRENALREESWAFRMGFQLVSF